MGSGIGMGTVRITRALGPFGCHNPSAQDSARKGNGRVRIEEGGSSESVKSRR
jgi:hypothetical protein